MLFRTILALLVTSAAAFSPMKPVMVRPVSDAQVRKPKFHRNEILDSNSYVELAISLSNNATFVYSS